MWYKDWLNESETPSVKEHCKPYSNGSEICVCFKQNKNTGTIHIFCCNEIINECTDKCLCNCIKKENLKTTNFDEFELCGCNCYPLEIARLIAAQLQNMGYNVCGTCVSALYHNEL